MNDLRLHHRMKTNDCFLPKKNCPKKMSDCCFPMNNCRRRSLTNVNCFLCYSCRKRMAKNRRKMNSNSSSTPDIGTKMMKMMKMMKMTLSSKKRFLHHCSPKNG
jgi:hypothetical protein